MSTLKGYVNEVAGFNRGRRKGVEIRPDMITGRRLEVAIPHRRTGAQHSAMAEVFRYGQAMDVEVEFVVIR